MAFCGALALQAFLAGRRVRDPGDNRTNLYLLGLAHSAVGKDWPRKLNVRILQQIGVAEQTGESFASGEVLQDALHLTPAMLFQTDEIDGLLQSISKSKDARYEQLMSTLLTMYSSANSVYPMGRKAGKETHVKNSQRLRLSARWKLRHFNTAIAALASLRFSIEYITEEFQYRSEYRKT